MVDQEGRMGGGVGGGGGGGGGCNHGATATKLPAHKATLVGWLFLPSGKKVFK